MSAYNSLKNFKQKYLYGLKNKTIFRQRRKNFSKKLKNIPSSFWKVFDEHSYLAINPDVKEAIEQRVFESAVEHFIIFGYKEVKEGKRRIGKEFSYFSEDIYLKYNTDLQEVKKNNPKFDLYKHFLEFGYKEILQGKRKVFQNENIYIYQEPKFTENRKKNIKKFKQKPLISIIMPVYNVDVKWLDLAIKSVEKQWYKNWELCIVDDASTKEETKKYLEKLKNPKIKVKFLEKNQGISEASNEALKLAKGEYIALMDNDDELTPDALYEVVKAINDTGAEFIYSDEDFISPEGNYINPHFKPDFSPDLLLSHNYITHLAVVHRRVISLIDGFRKEYDGAQDYDLFLRITENTKKIKHISKILYHWRQLPSSTSFDAKIKPEAILAGKKSLEDAIKRRKLRAKVMNGNLPHYFRIKYEIIDKPLVSIIIPFKDKPELLRQCIKSVLERTNYENFEIIGISNNSEEKETFIEMKRLENLDKRVKFYEYNIPFNYSKINNYAVKNFAKGRHIVLMNNDIEVINDVWLESMLEHSQREEVGCVGAKLFYPNDTIQHAGIIIGLGGYAAHSHRFFPKNSFGYFNRLNIIQNISAVTAALLMVKKEIYLDLNGMDEENFKIAYNDVDFCLRVLKKGYLNIFTPYALAYHYESLSRGDDNTGENKKRFDKEKKALFLLHGEIIKNGDPYYNPNLTLSREDFGLKGS